MARPDTAWDALSGDPLLSRYEGGDALPGESAGEYAGDALATGYQGDALGGAALADPLGGAALADAPGGSDPLAAPAGDGYGPATGDSLTAYGDATAAGRTDDLSRRATARRSPRPGPVPPRAADTPSPSPSRADRSPGESSTGRGGSSTADGSSRRTRPPPTLESTARGPVAGTTDRRPRPRPTAAPTARTGPAGQPSRATADGRQQGLSWDEIIRPMAREPRGRRHRANEVPAQPPWTTRPTGTVPWTGRSGGGWDDVVAGMGGTIRGGRSPSGADVARAVIQAFRRGRGAR